MKKKLLVFTIFITICILASAQVCQPKVDTATGKTISSGGAAPYPTFIGWSHKVSGTNRLLVVQVLGDRYSDSVKYAGVKLTRLDSTGTGSGTGKYNAEMWYQLNPPSGTDSVKVFYPPGSGTFNAAKSAEAISFTNVDQNTPFGTSIKSTASSKCLDSMLVRSDTNSLVLDCIINGKWQYLLTPDASQTKIYSKDLIGNNNSIGGSVKGGADSVYMNWTWSFCTSTANVSAYLAVPIKGFACITVGINEIKEEIMNLFPNPASTTLHYEINIKENAAYHIEVVDVTGKVLLSEKAEVKLGNNNLQVNVSALSPGMYFLKMINANGKYSTARFIKTE